MQIKIKALKLKTLCYGPILSLLFYFSHNSNGALEVLYNDHD